MCNKDDSLLYYYSSSTNDKEDLHTKMGKGRPIIQERRRRRQKRERSFVFLKTLNPLCVFEALNCTRLSFDGLINSF